MGVWGEGAEVATMPPNPTDVLIRRGTPPADRGVVGETWGQIERLVFFFDP